MDVFFYEAFEEEEKELKQFLPSEIQAGFTWKTIQESGHSLPPARLISTRTQSSFPPDWSSLLDGILSRSTGYDHLEAYFKLTGKKIQGGFLPLYCNRSVAEHAMTMWMSLLRKMPLQYENFKSFHRDGITGTETEGKTLLVVGVGNIGSQVVKIGNGLGMNVLGVDLIKKFPDVNYVSIEEGIIQADIIVCAMNLTNENHGYFSKDLLMKARKGTLLINISRGELAPSSIILNLIEEGHLGGAGLDVFINEKELAVSLRSGNKSNDHEVMAVHKLSKLKNVILTPHNAFNSIEAVERKSFQSIEQVVHFLKNGCFIWPVPNN